MMGIAAGDVNIRDEDFLRRCIGKQIKFAWLPKRCYLSGKLIWLRKGYKLTSMLTGPGDPIFDYRWHDVKEHIFWELKK